MARHYDLFDVSVFGGPPAWSRQDPPPATREPRLEARPPAPTTTRHTSDQQCAAVGALHKSGSCGVCMAVAGEPCDVCAGVRYHTGWCPERGETGRVRS